MRPVLCRIDIKAPMGCGDILAVGTMAQCIEELTGKKVQIQVYENCIYFEERDRDEGSSDSRPGDARGAVAEADADGSDGEG